MAGSEAAITGLVSNIQRHSTEDGPGIRTTVFLMGCPMHCPWCQNPEAMTMRPQLVWHAAKCIGARDCIPACPRSALNLTPRGMSIARKLCDVCGDCVDACPAAALELLGKEMPTREVVSAALRDRVFYEKSGGGVTLSGGEPAMQPEFCRAIMESLRQERVHIALDTCGGVNWEKLQPLVELADLVLLDLKVMDEDKHRELTGAPLDLVLDNARRIAEAGKPMWIRTPVIPGHTDDVENVKAVARFIRERLPTVERYDLLAFNNMCAGKYEKLGQTYPLATAELLAAEKMETLARAAREQGINNARWSGLTRREEKVEEAR